MHAIYIYTYAYMSSFILTKFPTLEDLPPILHLRVIMLESKTDLKSVNCNIFVFDFINF